MSGPGSDGSDFFDGFYKAFENKFRGSRELIKERLRSYDPFVSAALKLQSPARAIDLGCGRGEWLELLKEAGFEAVGIDLSEAMVAGCRDLGFDVRREDARTALQTLPADSQSIVSGLHIVEHMAFEDVISIVRESLRVLVPGGLLILETPNPDNIRVATHSFYFDPTHRNPLPSELLSFTAEFCGFARAKVLGFREDSQSERDSQEVAALLNSVSRDYAVVAQKGADRQTMVQADRAFDAQLGVAFVQLVASLKSDHSTEVADLRNQAANLANTKTELNEVIKGLYSVVEALQGSEARLLSDAAQREQNLTAQFNSVVTANLELRNQIDLFKKSTSWRMTAPLRWIVHAVRRGRKNG
jgi:O-antigen chain-terminating methyltransferase